MLGPDSLTLHPAVFYAAAIYPESEKLIDRASLFKIEGTFLNPNDGYKTGWGVGGRAEKQGYALLMLEEGNYQGMLEWIVGLADAFKVSSRCSLESKESADWPCSSTADPVASPTTRGTLLRCTLRSLSVLIVIASSSTASVRLVSPSSPNPG